MMISCAWLADVLAEKLTMLTMNLSFGRSTSRLVVEALLPVPEGPSTSRGTSWSRQVLRKNSRRAVSAVGIRSVETCVGRESACWGLLG